VRRRLREEMGQHLYTHLLKEFPFLRTKLTNPELNMVVHSISKWFCDEGTDPITLAAAVVKIMKEEQKSVAERAVSEPEFLNELDKI